MAPAIALPFKAAAAAASAITLADRAELLANLATPVNKTLRYRLRAGDAAGFDQVLLDYMRSRPGPTYFFDPADVPAYVAFAQADTASRSNLAQAAAEHVSTYSAQTLAHLFAVQGNSGDRTVQLPAGTIDWDAQPAGLPAADGPDFLHALNTHASFEDLAIGYRFTGDRRYARELAAELASWYQQTPPLRDPSTWADSGPHWWLLDAARRVDHWVRSYFLMVGGAGMSPEENTLFLAGLLRHGDFLSRVTPRPATSNWTTYHGAALHELGTLFPEFAGAATWRTQGTCLLGASLARQFRPDGGHVEQSPSYTATVLNVLLQSAWLDHLNGGAFWNRRTRAALTAAADALYKLTDPDSHLPALSDTYRDVSPYPTFVQAAEVLGAARFRLAAPTLEDVWLFGPDQVRPHVNDGRPGFGSRGPTDVLPDSGYYVVRGAPVTINGQASRAAQLVIDAGPTGGTHGHFDLLSVTLDTVFGPIVSDPGPAQYGTSAERARVVSTPAHNTISVDGRSHAAVADGDGQVTITQFASDGTQARFAATHRAYAGLKGSPKVARSVWFDQSGTPDPGGFGAMLLVDWGSASTPHTFTTSLNLPFDPALLTRKVRDGLLHVPSSGVEQFRVQSLLQAGQTLALTATNTYTSPPPSTGEKAARWAVSQRGTSALFVTLVAHEAGDGTGVTASIENLPSRSRPLRVRLHPADGSPDRVIEFPAPDLSPRPPAATSASPAAAAIIPPAVSPAASPFSPRPVRPADADWLSAADALF